ncbi:MAG: ArsR family transcriptional regulator [Candidatus Heimdallarchaeota archaeon]|nr:ArsR family transcriptional regulator [Candidatus Heimdallarchaeota archaeon]
MNNKRNILYSFWESLPPLKVIPQPEEEIYAHEARLSIIRILRMGILEEENGPKRRRALNAREILKLFKQNQAITQETDKEKDVTPRLEKTQEEFKPLSLQSLYFHLQKLEEAGLIQTVTILREGRHNTAYYGRTARIFLHTDPKKNELKIAQAFSAIIKFVSVNNPTFDKNRIEELLERLLLFEAQRRERISKWLTMHESTVIDHNIDLTSLFKFMELIDNINPNYIQIYRDLLEVLSFSSLP